MPSSTTFLHPLYLTEVACSASAPPARPLGSEAAFLSHFLPAPGNHPPPAPPWAASAGSGLGIVSVTPRGDPAASRHRAALPILAHAPQQPGHHTAAGEWAPPVHSQAARSLGVPHPGAPAGYGGAHYGAPAGAQGHQAHASQPAGHAHAAHVHGLAGQPGQQHGQAHAHMGWGARQAAQGLAPLARDWAGERAGSRTAAGCSPSANAAASPRFLAAAAPHAAAAQQRLTPRLSARAGPVAAPPKEICQATGSPAGPCTAEPGGRANVPIPGAATAASAAAAEGHPAAAAAAVGQRSPKRRRSQLQDAPRPCGAEDAAHGLEPLIGFEGTARSPGPGRDGRDHSERSAYSQHPGSSAQALTEAGSGFAAGGRRDLWTADSDVEAGRRPEEGLHNGGHDAGSRRVPALRLPQPHVQPAESRPGEPSCVRDCRAYWWQALLFVSVNARVFCLCTIELLHVCCMCCIAGLPRMR